MFGSKEFTREIFISDQSEMFVFMYSFLTKLKNNWNTPGKLEQKCFHTDAVPVIIEIFVLHHNIVFLHIFLSCELSIILQHPS